MSKRIYLAGPEVFLLHAREIGARKRAVCEAHGLVGVFSTDEEDACDPALPLPERGLAISRAIERAMQGCDAMIVNLTPFRGPSTHVIRCFRALCHACCGDVAPVATADDNARQ